MVARYRVCPGRLGGGRVVVEPVLVQIPCVRDRVAGVGIARAGPVERDVQRGGAGGRIRRRDGDRRPVGAEVADPADRAAVEVGVEEIAPRADFESDRVRCSGGERQRCGRVGKPVRACLIAQMQFRE